MTVLSRCYNYFFTVLFNRMIFLYVRHVLLFPSVFFGELMASIGYLIAVAFQVYSLHFRIIRGGDGVEVKGFGEIKTLSAQRPSNEVVVK